MTEVTKEDVEQVFTGILTRSTDELKAISDPSELERFWFFSYDPKASLEWNQYHFHSMLELYKNKCRRWEELHNGSCCVVERVRDRYLMPKIREWISIVKSTS